MKKIKEQKPIEKWEELKIWVKNRRDGFMTKSPGGAWPYERVLQQMDLIEFEREREQKDSKNA